MCEKSERCNPSISARVFEIFRGYNAERIILFVAKLWLAKVHCNNIGEVDMTTKACVCV